MSKRKEIIIIGNGQSVLEESFGEHINKFSIVGRINNFTTDKFSKFIGDKTNIWFNGANQNLKKRYSFPNEVIVLVPPEILNRKKTNIHKRIVKRLNIESNKYSLVPIETMLSYEKNSGIKRLTTGTASILWAIDNFETVVIYGFDFFIESKAHYNDNFIIKWLNKIGINKKGKKHDMKKEKSYINKLIKKKKVIQLKDYLLK